MQSAAPHLLCSHVCGLRGVFFEAHVLEKTDFNLISPPTGGETLPGAFSMQEQFHFLHSQWLFRKSQPPGWGRRAAVTGLGESRPYSLRAGAAASVFCKGWRVSAMAAKLWISCREVLVMTLQEIHSPRARNRADWAKSAVRLPVWSMSM